MRQYVHLFEEYTYKNVSEFENAYSIVKMARRLMPLGASDFLAAPIDPRLGARLTMIGVREAAAKDGRNINRLMLVCKADDTAPFFITDKGAMGIKDITIDTVAAAEKLHQLINFMRGENKQFSEADYDIAENAPGPSAAQPGIDQGRPDPPAR